ncbi:transglycosylase domain-containing protein [Aquabacterium sp. OR-4]|uniref:transglycosylase domain-containing protein n=1 Tax=Aquabacterium sp. OR-4 TaxID=2978127 RepID=UPI0028C512D4|nr:transglycosylase domain-containing protein [Aquabacterium sp. OR-4]MDT7834396.1 transglycosylase domain-containing protein [Aquabacterium sp. OR-4]
MAASKLLSGWRAQAWRVLALLLLSALSLQLFFAGRIALMALLDPASTSFERSEAWRLLVEKQRIDWRQDWADDSRIAAHLKRAVIASEDAGFADHSGVEWDAIERAWEKNQRAEAAAERRNAQLAQQAERQAERQAARQARGATPPPATAAKPRPRVEPKLIGGSTISQQLAKNLFLSGERTALRKLQEIVLTYELELILGKRRMLEIYLNHVEWGEGVFGAQAAARHYFRVDAAALGPGQAARLAVMLPAPKRFEKSPGSAYLAGRSGTIAARMGAVELP